MMKEDNEENEGTGSTSATVASESCSSWKDGPMGKPRRCTDFLFLLLLIASWAAMTFVGLVATGLIDSPHLIIKGDPAILFSGMDFQGNICGQTDFVTATGDNIQNLPFAYPLGSGGIYVCVEECPSISDFNQFHCRYETQQLIDENHDLSSSTTNLTDASMKSEYLYYTTAKKCLPHVASISYLGYCSPSVITEVLSEQFDILEDDNNNITAALNLTMGGEVSTGSFFDEAVADIYLTRNIILAFGLGFSVAVGFLFLLIIRMPGFLSTVIWGIILSINAGLYLGGYLLYQTSKRWEREGLKEAREIRALFVMSLVSYTTSTIWFVVIVFLRKRISLAIACVKEASTAISRMPIMIFFPFFQVIGFAAYLVPWLVYTVYLASSGEAEAACLCPSLEITSPFQSKALEDVITDGSNDICDEGCFQYKSFAYDQKTKYAGFYMLFNLFWTSQYIVSFSISHKNISEPFHWASLKHNCSFSTPISILYSSTLLCC